MAICPNCGKLTEGVTCTNCGATQNDATGNPQSSKPGWAWGPSSQGLGCFAGGVLFFLSGLLVPLAAFYVFNVKTPGVLFIMYAIVMGALAVVAIPVVLPAGRRFSPFLRWMLGTNLALIIFFLGAAAVCGGMLGGL